MNIHFHKRFEHDWMKLKQSGWNIKLLERFVSTCTAWPLPKAYEAHQLAGDLTGLWDAHIRQNWVVLFRKEKNDIFLLRTGTHAMLGIG